MNVGYLEGGPSHGQLWTLRDGQNPVEVLTYTSWDHQILKHLYWRSEDVSAEGVPIFRWHPPKGYSA